MVSKKTLNTLLATAVVMTIAGAAHAEDAAAPAAAATEKCFGVVKAASNDCAAANGSHSCAGQAAADAAAGEWINLPAGVCAKLVNGTTEAPAAAAPAETPAEAPAAEGHH